MGDDAEETIEEYYEALRSGEPLHPFFASSGPVVKVGIGERLVGAEAVAEGLREQTRTTEGWEVESHDLHVGVGGGSGDDREDATHAWFGDDVFMAWTDTERNIRFEFDTRWTGALVRAGAGVVEGDREKGEWRFVVMHVSTAGET